MRIFVVLMCIVCFPVTVNTPVDRFIFCDGGCGYEIKTRYITIDELYQSLGLDR